MRVGLVGCVKAKVDHRAAAKDLYVSTLFRGRRLAVEDSCDAWYILSAKHGLLDPDEVIESYDTALTSLPRAQRRAWSREIIESLRPRLGNLAGITFEIHAGSDYRDFGVVEGLRALGAQVEIPTQGLTFGEQLSFYQRLQASKHPTPTVRQDSERE